MSDLHVVTGAFGYSGQHIAMRLLEAGHRVRTLTNSTHRSNPFEGRVEVHPFHFDDPDRLAASLAGARVLYNTYWVRFNHGGGEFTHATAVENTRTLVEAARRAGVPRIVHTSITNPSIDSPLEYFRGKAQLERALVESGLSHAILRPAVLFGAADILVNNIAWMLRHLPVFGVFGDGQYRLQPIHVDDFARLAVVMGQSADNAIVDAIGPETFTYRHLVATIAAAIGVRRPIVPVPPVVGYWAGRALGWLLRDVTITREEIRGLMADLLCTNSQPAGTIRLTEWARAQAATLGRHYASELERRRHRERAYR
jgi:NADH dehydrogenase